MVYWCSIGGWGMVYCLISKTVLRILMVYECAHCASQWGPLVISQSPLLWSYLSHPSSGHISVTPPLVISQSPLLWSYLSHPSSGHISVTPPLVISQSPLLWSYLSHPSSGHISVTPPLVISQSHLLYVHGSSYECHVAKGLAYTVRLVACNSNEYG